MTPLLHDLLFDTATARPDAVAVVDRARQVSYTSLAELVERVAGGLHSIGVEPGERVATLLTKRTEKVATLFGTLAAGAVTVPINMLLKAPQVAHILHDCAASVLVTSGARLPDLAAEPGCLEGVKAVIVVDDFARGPDFLPDLIRWDEILGAPPRVGASGADADVAALFYTSGSTGRPKGVVLTHRNLLIGARSVAEYLGNTPDDRLLATLSFSFDYGFSQLSTAFAVGARVVLLDYRLPQEVVQIVGHEGVTGIAGVPPMWIQLAALRWPEETTRCLRYITNSGGSLPGVTLTRLRAVLPRTEVFLMYGLTEAFRSTYLPPAELERRPDSIGKAIPNAEVLVLRPDGQPCDPDEPGELVHCGPLVAKGYWNDPQRTEERFRRLPAAARGRETDEIAVWSGDMVRRDADGFLYFIGRRDEMIKTSGYRVSPTEVEEEAYFSGLVGDAVAIGVPHERLGQAIVIVASPAADGAADSERLLNWLRRRLPRYMVPLHIDWRESVPRTPNGKFDRNLLHLEFNEVFAGEKA